MEPLILEELRIAVQIPRNSGRLTPTARFTSVALKDQVPGLAANRYGPREAFTVSFDNAGASCYEATATVVRPIMTNAGQVVPNHPEFRAMLRAFLGLVMVDT